MNTDRLPLYDYVMAKLDARVRAQRTVANESGVPFSTLTKIAQRQIKEPGVHTIQRLADYFRAIDAEPACTCANRRHGPADRREQKEAA